MTGADIIKPERTLEQWVQRQQFLSAVEGAQNWLAMLRYHAVRYNWSEAGILLALADNICSDLRNTAPATNEEKRS
ncbi:hypothetical protein F8789_13590 [Salmonella enterica]|nr:hypothetical protein [Salmonella enterica]EDB0771451.1 hypothetical protein [Salmonella enterica]EID3730503.1 hypothetical protein [Salmonella enterica]EIL0899147.1 hypothetical protein [Salmonella enterica]EIO4092460.1 hypothetical protein [Salmonella enterica]